VGCLYASEKALDLVVVRRMVFLMVDLILLANVIFGSKLQDFQMNNKYITNDRKKKKISTITTTTSKTFTTTTTTTYTTTSNNNNNYYYYYYY
jgi:hypothetical protein